MNVHTPFPEAGRSTTLLRVPAADLRFNVAYACATEIQYFADQVRAALDRSTDPSMGLASVERAELAWTTHATELRRRLRTRMTAEQRRVFDQVDNLIEETDRLTTNTAHAPYFAVLWLGSAMSSRIAMAKLHGTTQFRSAVEASIRALRDYVERRWVTAQVAFIERYPWIDRESTVIRVEGMGRDGVNPVVVVSQMDTLP